MTTGSGSPISARCLPTSTPGPASRCSSWAARSGCGGNGITTAAWTGTWRSEPLHAGLLRFLADLGAVYRTHSELWRADPDLAGFSWLDADDRDHSIYSYFRRDGERLLLVLLNLTPVPRPDYRSGAPSTGRYTMVLSSDDPKYGGGGFGLVPELRAERVAWQNQPASIRHRAPSARGGAARVLTRVILHGRGTGGALARAGRDAPSRRWDPVFRLGAECPAGRGGAQPGRAVGISSAGRRRGRRAQRDHPSGSAGHRLRLSPGRKSRAARSGEPVAAPGRARPHQGGGSRRIPMDRRRRGEGSRRPTW